MQLRRPLRLAGALLVIGLVYLGNTRPPPEFRFGILYVIPVLLAAWHDGLGWGIAFAFATALLRFVVGIDQMPPGTALAARLANEGAYLAVVGVAITGLSQLRRTQGELHQLATQDTLTTVLNARAFSQELSQELGRNRRYGRPLALIYLDLDDFKRVNDAHGHATGDAVLRLVADAMRSAVRQAGFAGRLGGDEFGDLLPETDRNVAHSVANRPARGAAAHARGRGLDVARPPRGFRSGRQPYFPPLRDHDRGVQKRRRCGDRPKRAGRGGGPPQPAAGDGGREGRGYREGRRGD